MSSICVYCRSVMFQVENWPGLGDSTAEFKARRQSGLSKFSLDSCRLCERRSDCFPSGYQNVQLRLSVFLSIVLNSVGTQTNVCHSWARKRPRKVGGLKYIQVVWITVGYKVFARQTRPLDLYNLRPPRSIDRRLNWLPSLAPAFCRTDRRPRIPAWKNASLWRLGRQCYRWYVQLLLRR